MRAARPPGRRSRSPGASSSAAQPRARGAARAPCLCSDTPSVRSARSSTSWMPRTCAPKVPGYWRLAGSFRTSIASTAASFSPRGPNKGAQGHPSSRGRCVALRRSAASGSSWRDARNRYSPALLAGCRHTGGPRAWRILSDCSRQVLSTTVRPCGASSHLHSAERVHFERQT